MSDSLEPQDLSWENVRLFMRRPLDEPLPPFPAVDPGLVLRAGEPEHVSGLATLLTRAFKEMWTEEQVEERLTKAEDVEAVYLIAQGSRIVATASARRMPDEHPGAGYVHWVAVDPDYQGRGLGVLITLRVLRHFQASGVRSAVLETQSFRLQAQRTYLRLGFVPEARDAGELARWSRLLPVHLSGIKDRR